MVPIYLLALLILGIPAMFVLMYLNVAALSFAKLGLSPQGAFLLLSMSLVGSLVNIPIFVKRVVLRGPGLALFPVFYFFPPIVQESVLAVNLGGAVIPSLFSLYLMRRADPAPTIISTAIVTLVSYRVARPVPGRGILLPAYVPPLAAVLCGLVFGKDNPAVIAYISGTMGTLIGADLMHLGEIFGASSGILSIGGAGVYDGIFLAGLLAVLLA